MRWVRLWGSEGQVDGSVVFYGGVGVGSDVDIAMKPSTLGFSAETFLRSERSPETLYFRVGMPQGASLVQEREAGGVGVVEQGRTIADIFPPSATDAAGSVVPVSMSVSGDTLMLSVARDADEEYPVDVDPTVVDSELLEAEPDGNWAFESNS